MAECFGGQIRRLDLRVPPSSPPSHASPLFLSFVVLVAVIAQTPAWQRVLRSSSPRPPESCEADSVSPKRPRLSIDVHQPCQEPRTPNDDSRLSGGDSDSEMIPVKQEMVELKESADPSYEGKELRHTKAAHTPPPTHPQQGPTHQQQTPFPHSKAPHTPTARPNTPTARPPLTHKRPHTHPQQGPHSPTARPPLTHKRPLTPTKGPTPTHSKAPHTHKGPHTPITSLTVPHRHTQQAPTHTHSTPTAHKVPLE
ncbi:hypothetical protein E2C01_004509 [Portunus trituberculatus]|uniref:Uncharacterized protein n=1 Tax=Portunus trituberculatus TaxID=210409 RepID=A0A5B7CT64_PORTR|nr:hypothetical protein [Portunus trituberculatus]